MLLEAYENRMETKDRRAAFGAWLSARLSRAKRIMPFARLWRKETTAHALPPEEAAKEYERHQRLIKQLAPETLQDTEKSDTKEASHGS